MKLAIIAGLIVIAFGLFVGYRFRKLKQGVDKFEPREPEDVTTEFYD